MAMKMKNDLPMIKFTCPKCGNRKYSVKEIRVAYNVFTQLFDIQAARYTAIVCDKCKYTEFYNVPVKKINGVFDFFVGG
jgi:predicted nucleic-acid-binding Zn-ribbon protein